VRKDPEAPDYKPEAPDYKLEAPDYKLVVLPWLRRIGQRFVLPNWLAITIWRWIFAWRPLDDAELAHELAHVRQWRRHGLLFIPRYLGASRQAARAGGDRYGDNAFEVEAEAAAEAVRRLVGSKS
jgi:hypothetical protein